MISLPDTPQSIVLRLTTDIDASTVRRLAALDDAPRLTGSVLLALVDGEPVAAMSLDDGRVVADPFRPTAHEVALLRLHAAHLARPVARRQQRPARWRRGSAVLRPRAA